MWISTLWEIVFREHGKLANSKVIKLQNWDVAVKWIWDCAWVMLNVWLNFRMALLIQVKLRRSSDWGHVEGNIHTKCQWSKNDVILCFCYYDQLIFTMFSYGEHQNRNRNQTFNLHFPSEKNVRPWTPMLKDLCSYFRLSKKVYAAHFVHNSAGFVNYFRWNFRSTWEPDVKKNRSTAPP